MMPYFQAGNSIIAKKWILFVSGILKIKHEAVLMHSLAHAAVSSELPLWLTVGKGDGQALCHLMLYLCPSVCPIAGPPVYSFLH